MLGRLVFHRWGHYKQVRCPRVVCSNHHRCQFNHGDRDRIISFNRRGNTIGRCYTISPWSSDCDKADACPYKEHCSFRHYGQRDHPDAPWPRRPDGPLIPVFPYELSQDEWTTEVAKHIGREFWKNGCDRLRVRGVSLIPESELKQTHDLVDSLLRSHAMAAKWRQIFGLW